MSEKPSDAGALRFLNALFGRERPKSVPKGGCPRCHLDPSELRLAANCQVVGCPVFGVAGHA